MHIWKHRDVLSELTLWNSLFFCGSTFCNGTIFFLMAPGAKSFIVITLCVAALFLVATFCGVTCNVAAVHSMALFVLVA
jgi:hypothetical protein